MSNFSRYRKPIGAGAVLLAVLLLSITTAPPLPTNPTETKQGAACHPAPQMAPVPYHVEARSIQSGRHTSGADGDKAVFSTLAQSLDAPWLQVQFGSIEPGSSSYLRSQSLSDGAVQQLDAAALALWHNQSAMFKGDAVKIELYAAPEDKDVFFEVQALHGRRMGGRGAAARAVARL